MTPITRPRIKCVTWLHVSDVHFTAHGDPYDRDVVLRSLVAAARRFHEQGRRPDLVFFTGDIAYSGKREEYVHATRFFDSLLQAVELDRKRLFVVPGNHDVDRAAARGLARTLTSEEESVAFFNTGSPSVSLREVRGSS